MSDGLVKRAREVATEARDDFAQYWFDAEKTGERPDLILIEANVPVEWIEHMADRIEELEAKLKTSEEIGRAFEEDAGQLRANLALIKEYAIAGASNGFENCGMCENILDTLVEINGGGDE